MAETPFTVNPTLSAIAVAYTNGAMIADQVLPRIAPVGTKEFRYTTFPKGEAFTVPDTRVGRRGRPNVVEFGGSEATSVTYDYALDDEIPQDDIDQAAAARALNPELATPEAHSTELLTDLIVLDREVRTANLVFNAASYDAANKVQLAGADQFSDPAADPIEVITDALDGMLMRANVAVMGQVAWSKTRRNANLVKAIHGTTGDKGVITKQQFLDLFELEDLLVGESWVNTAKKGQTEQFARAWGPHIALIRRNKLADTRRGVTFGYTVPYGTRVAWSRPDSDVGMRGGQRIRVGESVRELIVAADAGYFIQDAVAT
jgi:hypothetical protein